MSPAGECTREGGRAERRGRPALSRAGVRQPCPSEAAVHAAAVVAQQVVADPAVHTRAVVPDVRPGVAARHRVAVVVQPLCVVRDAVDRTTRAGTASLVGPIGRLVPGAAVLVRDAGTAGGGCRCRGGGARSGCSLPLPYGYLFLIYVRSELIRGENEAFLSGFRWSHNRSWAGRIPEFRSPDVPDALRQPVEPQSKESRCLLGYSSPRMT